LFTKRKAKLRFQYDWQQGIPFEADIKLRPTCALHEPARFWGFRFHYLSSE
jgi:hypothetical protein